VSSAYDDSFIKTWFKVTQQTNLVEREKVIVVDDMVYRGEERKICTGVCAQMAGEMYGTC
jgi:hypothetical protein